jgi:hypothetical protein
MRFMDVEKIRVDDNQLWFTVPGGEIVLSDGEYVSSGGDSITVVEGVVTDVTPRLDVDKASLEQLKVFLTDLDGRLAEVSDEVQLANVDMQGHLQKMQQTLQMMANVAKQQHDTAMAVIRKIGG